MTAKKNKPGSQNVTGNRKMYKLIRFLNARLDSTSDKVAMQAADRLTEIFLKQEETKQKEIDRHSRRLAKAKDQREEQPAVPHSGPVEQPVQEPNDYERAEASSAYAKAVSDHFARIAERVKKEGR